MLYAAGVAGVTVNLPVLPFQYADYASWQRDHLQGNVLTALLAFWKHFLKDLPPSLNLPFDQSRPQGQPEARHLTTRLAPALVADLKALARREGATLHSVLLSAFAVLLHRYCDETDIVLGGTLINRPLAEVQRVVGFFANTLVFRLDVGGMPTMSQMISRTKQMMLEAQAHQGLPFQKAGRGAATCTRD